jgi:glycosyltransferase involved in cell wall biosynthesis
VNTGTDLAIIIPLWLRTKNIARVYESATTATPDANVLFVASEGDVYVRETLEGFCLNHILTPGPGGDRGDYARKINVGYRETREPFIFTGADDILFDPGWYAPARALISEGDTLVDDEGVEFYRMGGVGVVGTVDGCNGRTMDGTHSTHTLVARWYADQGGPVDEDHAIYFEGYYHEYCDDELCRVAMVRGAYAHSFDSLVRHDHMLLDPSLDDDTYRHGRGFTRMSRRLFLQRRRMWGDQ